MGGLAVGPADSPSTACHTVSDDPVPAAFQSPSASAASVTPVRAAMPQPRTDRRKTLDHMAYPHVFDLVFAYATRPALYALRGTSRAMLDRVSAVLYRHVELDLRPERNQADLPLIRFPFGGPRVPGLRWDPSDPLAHALCIRRMAEHCKVLDDFRRYASVLLTKSPSNEDRLRHNMADLRKALGGVKILRFRSNLIQSTRTSASAHVWPCNLDTTEVYVPPICPHNAKAIQFNVPTALRPRHLGKVVATLSIHHLSAPSGTDDLGIAAMRCWLHSPIMERGPTDHVEFAMIFLRGAVGTVGARIQPPDRAEFTYTAFAGPDDLRRRVTIVGAEQFRPQKFKHDSSHESSVGDVHRLAITAQKAEWAVRGWPIDVWDRYTDEDYQFFTLDEYRKQVSEEEYALTVPDQAHEEEAVLAPVMAAEWDAFLNALQNAQTG